ncbi:DEAD/DEAH box helicase [Proteiniclasticum sp. QWL-01]|uniref:DEAD/DEAH box helicase n=1 Tax=Proteiniclasticum sp. QWL-01 TaxID=3036945 RepID=UPI00240ECB23|nr:DEAD/DEAH box helicase [Proteiniclasticum sp. QWL-01]WFF71762.1 DEAD/DEAH box helicase [Proteiniclasticum sp. QWL-01]
MNFKELNVIGPILKALEKEKYESPTPIQEQAIPHILKQRDLLGCAQTGTGKTAAFAVPMLQLLSKKGGSGKGNRSIKALVLTPTRELAIQIYDSFRTYGQFTNLTYGVIFGGVSQVPQEQVLRTGIDILVATPGRLNDLIGQGLINLKALEIFVLDEADRMLDMGFLNDVKKVIRQLPAKKQTLLFSATMSPDIMEIANSILVKPEKVSVTPVSSAVDTVQQVLYHVDKGNKKELLKHLLQDPTIDSALVFSRTKHGADKIVKDLERANIKAAAIHGNKSQGNRQTALSNFKNRVTRVLVATDIAARGIDIDELSHVFNYDLPNVPETYIHRIGRTGRAGLEGTAISFCDFDEKPLLKDIEKLMGKKVPEVKNHPYPMVVLTPAVKAEPQRPANPRKNSKAPVQNQPRAAGTRKQQQKTHCQ